VIEILLGQDKVISLLYDRPAQPQPPQQQQEMADGGYDNQEDYIAMDDQEQQMIHERLLHDQMMQE